MAPVHGVRRYGVDPKVPLEVHLCDPGALDDHGALEVLDDEEVEDGVEDEDEVHRGREGGASDLEGHAHGHLTDDRRACDMGSR